jgi:hypothetical protein
MTKRRTSSLKFFVRIGQKFHKYTVLESHHPVRSKSICQCDCGKVNEILNQHLYTGARKQCWDCATLARTEKFITFEGKSLSLQKACKLAGIPVTSVRGRVREKLFSPQESFDFFIQRKATQNENSKFKTQTIIHEGKSIKVKTPNTQCGGGK